MLQSEPILFQDAGPESGEGAKAPLEWFGLNPEDSEDSAKVIDSSDKGEDAEDEESEEDTPEVGWVRG